MFVVLIGLVVVALHGYLWKRLVKDTTRPGPVRRAGTAAMIVLAVLLPTALALSRQASLSVARWFEWPGYLWLGLFAYLLLFLVVLELPRFVVRRVRPVEATATSDTATPAEPDLDRRLFVARGFALVAGAASAGMVGVGMGTALGPPEVKRLTIALPKLDPSLAGFRIAVVSDIHLGPILGRAHTERLVRMINETEPDLVAIVGDLADGSVADLGPAAEPLRDLVAAQGSFFVTGNHEYYSGHQEWLAEVDRLGVHPLRNELTTIGRGGATFDLAGINDVAGRGFADGPDLNRALTNRNAAAPVVLLAHQPVQVEDAALRKVDLQLSGHTHGGQFWPFGYVVGLSQPSLAGLSKVDETWLYVTKGAGFWGPPVRTFVRPDITVVELTP